MIPLKGSILIPTLYRDYALREMGDIDFLIKEKTIPEVESLLKGLGYTQGSYDEISGLRHASRGEILHRRILTHELYEFVKVSPKNSLWNSYMVDVNFRMLWKADKINNIKNDIDSSLAFDNLTTINHQGVDITILSQEIQFIHLCMHLYSEAVFFMWDNKFKKNMTEICLFRYCDIREYITQKNINWEIVDSIVRQYNLTEIVSYVLSSLAVLYNDCILYDKCGKYLGYNIDYYYDKTGCKKLWKTSFVNRLFEPRLKYNEICLLC